MDFDLDNPFDPSRNAQWLREHREFAGPVTEAVPMPQESLRAYASKVPATLLDLWKTDGLRTLYNGQLWMCDPAEFAPVSGLLFRGDPDLDAARTHIFGYTVFGKIIFYNEDHNCGEVDLVNGVAKCRGLAKGGRRRNANLSVLSALESFDSDAHHADEQDEDGKWLYKRAVKALGRAEYGECYGFVPALALGGARRLEAMKRVRAVEHFAFLAQTDDFVLRDYASRPIRDVRLLGPQG